MRFAVWHVCVFGWAGAALLGDLQCSGIGTPLTYTECKPVDELWQARAESNVALLSELREDAHATELLAMTQEDARLGRMTPPVPITEAGAIDCLLSPRFAVEQAKPDGSIKLRAVDNFSWADGNRCEAAVTARPSKRARKELSVNGHTMPKEKLKHDTLDHLAACMRMLVALTGVIPGLWKADIDAAFRRVPVRACHRWACGVAFVVHGVVRSCALGCCLHVLVVFWACGARHITPGMPLARSGLLAASTPGKEWAPRCVTWPASATNFAVKWRLGRSFACALGRLLKLPVFSYVDDYFAPDRPEALEHGLGCFARLVRILLGAGAVAERKMEFGPRLCILGVDLHLSNVGFQCLPSADKAERWIEILLEAVARLHLPPGLSSKVAGKLSWGCTRLFHRVGRAMLRPFFDQRTRRDGAMDSELRRAAEWWIEVLQHGVAEVREWHAPELPPVHLFCDARGEPPHLAAVLFCDGQCLYTHLKPAPEMLQRFKSRRDNQIMGLELLSISLGLSTFQDQLRGRKVVIHSDNSGSEVGLLPRVPCQQFAVRCLLG